MRGFGVCLGAGAGSAAVSRECASREELRDVRDAIMVSLCGWPGGEARYGFC